MLELRLWIGAGLPLLNLEICSHEEYTCPSSVIIGYMLVLQIIENASCHYEGHITKIY